MTPEQRFQEFIDQREGLVRAHLAKTENQDVRRVVALQVAAAARSPLRGRYVWLRKAAATLTSSAAEISPCKRGCDACCHVPVTLLASEAQEIGRAIGVRPLDIPEGLRDLPAPTWRGAGHACPFLADGACAIYENRPMACRLLVSLDKDEALCQHGDEPNLVPYLDTSQLQMAVVVMVAKKGGVDYMGELRDFFPGGLTNEE